MDYKVSVIIPVYNAEKYLKNAIESVINQTIGFENIELILVDDNSTDDSPKIILDYSEKYENIVSFLSNENHGLPGFGRNWGIKYAHSDYLLFLDNDDMLDKEICKNLYEVSINESSDICCGNECWYYGEDSILTCDNSLYDGEYVSFYDDEIILNFNNVLHGTLFRRKFLIENNIYFTEELSSEDFIFSNYCFVHAHKLIQLLNYSGYIWRVRENSLSHSSTEYIVGSIDASYHVLDMLKRANKEKFIPYVFAWTPRVFLRYYLKSFTFEKKAFVKLYEFEKEINFNINRSVFWSDFINYFVIHQHFTITIFLMKIMRYIVSRNFLKKIYRKLR